MPEDRMNPQSQDTQNVETNKNKMQHGQDEAFESDTHKIIRRHLENKNDIITDEDIANVRVGMTPPLMDAATEARFEDEDAEEKAEERALGNTQDSKPDQNLENEKTTPWDTVDPT
jgi:hypothetical protein